MTTTTATTHGIHSALAQHPGFTRVFGQGHLTLGFILPLEGYPNSATPTLAHHAEMAQLAEELGFAALWARDVPLLDPNFGDAGQMLDPYVYLGYLAARTRTIALGTASTVLTLRHPIHTAKQASSVDFLSNGRVVLGVASGDRPVEYPAFGLEHEYESRGERFQEAFSTIRALTEQRFPEHSSPRFGTLNGQVDMLPKPVHGRLPLLVTGRSRQDLPWIAKNADGWLFYNVQPQRLGSLIEQWNSAVAQANGPQAFKPFAQGFFFDLDADPDAPLMSGGPLLRGGRNAFVRFLQQAQALGLNHVAMNLKASRRPAREVLQELAQHVLPHFPSLDQGTTASSRKSPRPSLAYA